MIDDIAAHELRLYIDNDVTAYFETEWRRQREIHASLGKSR